MNTQTNNEMRNAMAQLIAKGGYKVGAPVMTVEHGTATVRRVK